MGSTTKHSLFSLGVFLALCFGAAWFGSQFEPGEWYTRVAKPPWTPPDGVFGPVWTFLYASMGIAAWLVWKKQGLILAALPLAVFIVQLVLNAAWSWIFFGLHRPGWALGELLVLWLAILWTMVLFWRHSRIAGALLAPCLAWVSFAALLNFAIWRMNA